MDWKRWRLMLAIGLVALSAAAYFVHYLIFHDAHHIFIYMVGDIAFVPLEVLLVTMVLHELLTRREKRAMLSKLNMVIGAFFSEVGTDGLSLLAGFDPDAESLASSLRPRESWKSSDFGRARRVARDTMENVDSNLGDLAELRDFLATRREFLLRLLENPNLLEHETFTDLLWATLHLTEELLARTDLAVLPDSDMAHLSGDIRRAYAAIAVEWLNYMEHLKVDYPYLFSLAVRTNPFDPAARVEVV